jgi:hypothetical protein
VKLNHIDPPKEGVDVYFIASDFHSEHLNMEAYTIFKKHIQLIKRDRRRIVILGDFLDCEHLMGKKPDFERWAQSVPIIEQVLIPKSQKEFEWGNYILSELQELSDYVYYVAGNHCGSRYDNWRDNYCPFEYKHHFDLKARLNLDERGIPLINYNDWLDVGNLSMTHGQFHGSTHLSKHYMACTKNVIYGHMHQAESKSFFHRGDAKKAWSLPCMCNLNPDYIKNRDMNWSNGYAVCCMKPNGNFNMHIHEIWDNELILSSGEILTP